MSVERKKYIRIGLALGVAATAVCLISSWLENAEKVNRGAVPPDDWEPGPSVMPTVLLATLTPFVPIKTEAAIPEPVRFAEPIGIPGQPCYYSSGEINATTPPVPDGKRSDSGWKCNGGFFKISEGADIVTTHPGNNSFEFGQDGIPEQAGYIKYGRDGSIEAYIFVGADGKQYLWPVVKTN